MSSPLIELLTPQGVFQSKEVHVRAEGHFAHTIRVEVELVFNDLGEVLKGY